MWKKYQKLSWESQVLLKSWFFIYISFYVFNPKNNNLKNMTQMWWWLIKLIFIIDRKFKSRMYDILSFVMFHATLWMACNCTYMHALLVFYFMLGSGKLVIYTECYNYIVFVWK